jgi:K+-transporting ATPase ATPase A chain
MDISLDQAIKGFRLYNEAAGRSKNAYRMIRLSVQNFASSAAGMAFLVALIRGIKRHYATTLGDFWVDLLRGVLYILLPLALMLALALFSQEVI